VSSFAFEEIGDDRQTSAYPLIVMILI